MDRELWESGDTMGDTVRHEQDFVHANILRAIVETTGSRGGDSGHGGRTRLIVTDLSSTAWEIVITDRDGQRHVFDPGQIELVMSGDAEMVTLTRMLRWAAERLVASGGLKYADSSDASDEPSMELCPGCGGDARRMLGCQTCHGAGKILA